MYCPRCGRQFSGKTSYCRTCGLSLDGVNEIVTGEAATAPERTSRPNNIAIRLGMSLFILGTVLGLANAVLRDLDLYPEIYGKAIFLSFVMAGLLSIGVSFLFPSTKYKKRQRPEDHFEDASTGGLITAPIADQLTSGEPDGLNIVFPKETREAVMAEHSSVTEHTTRQLK